MTVEHLRLAAFCAYLGSWLAFAILGFVAMRRAAARGRIGVPSIVGILLQAGAVWAVTKTMPGGPLRPSTGELWGSLMLAPLAAILFYWSIISVPKNATDSTLVTGGAYGWVRHPSYLAFLAMLVATGLLVSSGWRMLVPVVLFLAGSELRIGAEELELSERFPAEFGEYRRRTRFRYLPGLR